MTALAPYARLRDCLTDTVIASTTNVLSYQITRPLDALATLSLTFGAADAGDATTGPSFAAALLEAASDLGASPKPLIVEFSLDGGTAFDSRRLVRQPNRALVASGRTIEESGTDLGDILSALAIERATYTNCALSDVLAGNPSRLDAGTIVPLSRRGFMSISEPIPYLTGLFVVDYSAIPGLASWAAGARARLTITAVLAPSIQSTATNVDSDSDTVLNAASTIVSRLAASAPDQSVGHWVLDSSDASLNLSGSTSFSPPPTAVGMAYVVGNLGTSPHVTFDASASGDVNEATTARVHLDSCTVQTDDSLLYAADNMVGGTSTAGFPEGAQITALGVLNGHPPAQSTGKDQWYDGLPLVGIANNNDEQGGLYFTILDGRITPLPGSPRHACHSLAVDVGKTGTPSRSSALYMGTPWGVFYAQNVSGVSLYPDRLTWNHLDGLDGDVVRLFVMVDPSDTGHNVLLALVRGSKKAAWDGVWMYTAAHGWTACNLAPNILDMVATDFQTVWVILDQKGSHEVVCYSVSPTAAATVFNRYTVPAGVPYALGRAIVVAQTIGGTSYPAQDSVWALVSGAPTPAYYIWREDPNPWPGPSPSPWVDANSDNTLHGLDGNPLEVYCVSGSGVTVDSAYAGPTINVMIGTSLGALWSPERLGGSPNWISADMGGLGNYAVRHIAQGEGQTILGRALCRVFCATDDDILYSSSSARWWETIRGRDRTLPLVYLSEASISVTTTLPPNTVRTWGTQNADGTNMTASPLGLGSTTHCYIPSSNAAFAVPKGYYFERYLDAHQEFQCRLVSQSAHLPGQQMSQLPQIQTRTSVAADKAAAGVAQVMQRWLRQHATARTHLSIQSSFATQESALRTLRPTHKVALIGAVTMRAVSSTGALVSTQIINFSGTEPLYVISHEITKAGNIAHTTTVLADQLLEQPASPEDLMAALHDDIRNVRAFR